MPEDAILGPAGPNTNGKPQGGAIPVGCDDIQQSTIIPAPSNQDPRRRFEEKIRGTPDSREPSPAPPVRAAENQRSMSSVTRSPALKSYARPGRPARRGSESIFTVESLNLRGSQEMDALLHGQARKTWTEARGDAR